MSLSRDEAAQLLPALPVGAELLICRLRSLGDMVLETAVIGAVHAWRPDLRLSVLVEPWCAQLLEGNPAVSEVILSGSLAETGLRLRRRRFAAVYNQHAGPRSALLTAASLARRRVCWAHSQFSFLYNVLVPGKREYFGSGGAHAIDHRLSQFHWTGLPVGAPLRTRLYPQPGAEAEVVRKLAALGLEPGAPYVVLQPAARTPYMRWPVERFAALARWLYGEFGLKSVVNVGRRDEPLAGLFREAFADCAVVAEELNVRELIALLAGARLYVGNDSGPTHMAVAVDCPTVAFFSETDPEEWGPRQGAFRLLCRREDPARKGKPMVGEPAIAAITLAEVEAAVAALLAETVRG